jgi:cell division protein FtsQ
MPRPAAIADACGRALRRALPAAAVTLAALGLGAAAWGGYRWLTSSPRFAITAIEVTGAHRVDPDELRAALPVHLGDNVFAATGELARAVRRGPGGAWIAQVEVRRVLPHTLAIELREHVAAAIVEAGDRYLVDADGRPFKRAEPGDADAEPGLPVIAGLPRARFAADPAAAAATVRAAIAAHRAWAAADRPAIARVDVDAHGALTLRAAHPPVAIRLGALGPELDGRMHTFDAAWAGLSQAERARATAIHLDARTDHVTVALGPADPASKDAQ